MNQPLGAFRDGQRVTVIAAAHQLHGRTGIVVRKRRCDDGAWVQMDEPLPPNLVLFADERARHVLLYPDECAAATRHRAAATKWPVWKEAVAVAAHEKAAWYARLGGCRLTISITRGGVTHAAVERKRAGDGCVETLARSSWARETPEMLANAQRWCERWVREDLDA